MMRDRKWRRYEATADESKRPIARGQIVVKIRRDAELERELRIVANWD